MVSFSKYVLILIAILFVWPVGQSATAGQITYAGFSAINHQKKFFVVVGDTQKTSHWEFWRERNDIERKAIVNEIGKLNPAFLIHLGDLTTRGSSSKHWQDFDLLHKELRKKQIPYFPVLGNHELYGDNEMALRHYFSRFPHLDKRRWYSFSWEGIAFIMLDSNFSHLSEEQFREQVDWYAGELKRFELDDSVAHIVVCCHEPPYSNGKVVPPNSKVRTYFAEPFQRSGKTSLFLSGHSHAYERFLKDDKTFIVSGGGGGPRHNVNTDTSSQSEPDQYKGPGLRFFHFCEIALQGHDLFVRVRALFKNEEFDNVESVLIRRQIN